jgi:hypothetical protein
MKTWHAFAFLIVVAILIHNHMHYPILLIAALYAFFRFYLFLCGRCPLTMTFVTSFLWGLFGGRRRW